MALNLDQFVALASQSRFSRRNESFVVLAFIMALAKTVAPWQTLFLGSTDALMFFRIWRSVALFLARNCLSSSMGISPDTIWSNRVILSFGSSVTASAPSIEVSLGSAPSGAGAGAAPGSSFATPSPVGFDLARMLRIEDEKA